MRRTPAQTFVIPFILLLATIIGLVIGLIADGWQDWVAIAGLAIPLLVALRAIYSRPSRQARRKR